MELPKRKPTRLQYFDYSSYNYYFITICTHEKKCIFGKPDKLNIYGKIAKKYIIGIENAFPDISVDQYVVMPNHIHMILIVNESEERKSNVSTVVGQYKMMVTKEIRKIKPDFVVWQRSFHDHIIRNQRSYYKIWEYVKYNHQKWMDDCYFIDNNDEI